MLSKSHVTAIIFKCSLIIPRPACCTHYAGRLYIAQTHLYMYSCILYEYLGNVPAAKDASFTLMTTILPVGGICHDSQGFRTINRTSSSMCHVISIYVQFIYITFHVPCRTLFYFSWSHYCVTIPGEKTVFKASQRDVMWWLYRRCQDICRRTCAPHKISTSG